MAFKSNGQRDRFGPVGRTVSRRCEEALLEPLAKSVVSEGAPFASELLSSNQPPLVVDVRAPREREQKHIGGSLSIPLSRLAENLERLPKNRSLLVYCAGGYRSSIAASFLQRGGFDSVGEIVGGIAAWEAAKLPVLRAEA